jgi:hypothetical protein
MLPLVRGNGRAANRGYDKKIGAAGDAAKVNTGCASERGFLNIARTSRKPSTRVNDKSVCSIDDGHGCKSLDRERLQRTGPEIGWKCSTRASPERCGDLL